jgi:hypothetical protein
MAINQYQRQINTLDKEIIQLKKKRAEEDKKAANFDTKASKVTIGKNASVSSIRIKSKQIEQYKNNANKSRVKSAEYSKKIGEKSRKRNDTYLRLQKAQESEDKKKERDNTNMRLTYEKRIEELESRYSTPRDLENRDQLTETREFDVFISHAWEDKGDFVNEFVEELDNLGIKVWYDDIETKWGSSLREEIDRGLKFSRYGIVVLSPNYIDEKKYWTKKELNGLFQMESLNEGIILPIWHNLTKKDIVNYSPIIADKKAMTTATLTPKEMADEFCRLIQD